MGYSVVSRLHIDFFLHFSSSTAILSTSCVRESITHSPIALLLWSRLTDRRIYAYTSFLRRINFCYTYVSMVVILRVHSELTK